MQRFVIPDVAPFNPIDIALGTLDHQHSADVRAALQGLVDVLFQRDVLAAAYAFISGDHGLAVGIEDAVAQGVRGKPAEHHRMHRADAGAGQHRISRFRHHRHVDAHAIAFLHPALFQHVSQASDIAMEFFVGDFGGLGRVVALPDDCHLIAARLQMPVDAVVTDIQFAALEPAGGAGLDVRLLNLIPVGKPVEEALGLFRPEGIGLFNRLPVHALVVVGTELSGLARRIGLWEIAEIEHGVSCCSCDLV